MKGISALFDMFKLDPGGPASQYVGVSVTLLQTVLDSVDQDATRRQEDEQTVSVDGIQVTLDEHWTPVVMTVTTPVSVAHITLAGTPPYLSSYTDLAGRAIPLTYQAVETIESYLIWWLESRRFIRSSSKTRLEQS